MSTSVTREHANLVQRVFNIRHKGKVIDIEDPETSIDDLEGVLIALIAHENYGPNHSVTIKLNDILKERKGAITRNKDGNKQASKKKDIWLEQDRHFTANEIEAYLFKSTTVGKYIGANPNNKKSISTAGVLILHDSKEDFIKAGNDSETKGYIDYFQKNNDGKKPSEKEISAFLDKRDKAGIMGFTEYGGNAIHLLKGVGGQGTGIHEALHYFSHNNLKIQLGNAFNEGITEYLKLDVCKEFNIQSEDAYTQEVEIIKELIEYFGLKKDDILKAYFLGDIGSVSNIIRRLLKDAEFSEEWIEKFMSELCQLKADYVCRKIRSAISTGITNKAMMDDEEGFDL